MHPTVVLFKRPIQCKRSRKKVILLVGPLRGGEVRAVVIGPLKNNFFAASVSKPESFIPNLVSIFYSFVELIKKRYWWLKWRF